MRRYLISVSFTLTALALSGCAPEIGDPCSSSLDCPDGATCDTTASGGYCLMFECEQRTCPEGSVCIPFRTFSACMKHCSGDGDCRTEDGHVCRSDRGPAPFCYHPEGEP